MKNILYPRVVSIKSRSPIAKVEERIADQIRRTLLAKGKLNPAVQNDVSAHGVDSMFIKC
jgi:hypothetical protein